MKHNLKYIAFSFLAILFISSCGDDPDGIITYPEISESANDAVQDIIINTPVVSFVAGTESYTIDFLVRTPNSDNVKNIEVYKQFTNASDGSVSDRLLLGTYPVAAGANTTSIVDQVTYAQLSDGLGLPSDELAIPIGSKWDLTFDAKDGSGGTAFTTGTIVLGVLSPFAGTYQVIESDYYRIGVQSGGADWTGSQIFIGSVDANTFSHNDWWGPFESPGFFVFDLNDDNTITVTDTPEQLFFSGNDMLTCQEDGSSFVNVPCDGSNVLEPSDDGKHIIKLTYGYFTASGDENEGAREFYEVLEKID